MKAKLLLIALFIVLGVDMSSHVKAQSGNALDFDGSNDYVSAPLPMTKVDDLTLEAWVYLNGMPLSDAQQVILSYGTEGASLMNGIAIALYGNELCALMSGVSWGYTGYHFTVANKWYHVAFIRSSGTLTAYVDGVAAPNTSTAIPFTPTTDLRIGSQDGIRNFNGKVDEVRVWDIPRLQTDIQTDKDLYISSSHPQWSHLKAYYRFDQGDAGQDNVGVVSLIDYSGNCLNGTLTNFALTGTSSNWVSTGNLGAPIVGSVSVGTISTSTAIASANILSIGGSDVATRGFQYATDKCFTTNLSSKEETGTFNSGSFSLNIEGLQPELKYYVRAFLTNAKGTTYGDTASFTTLPLITPAKNALSFDGVNDYVSAPLPMTQVDNFTLEAWISLGTLTESGVVISYGNDDGVNGDGVSIAFNGTSEIGLLISGQTYVNSGYSFTAINECHHVALVSDNGTISIYIDGIKAPNTATNTPYTPTDFRIGGQKGIRFFNGKIDEVRVWNVARSLCELKSNMNISLSGSESGLVAYYNFNSGTANGTNTGVTTLTDKTSNSNNGTLNNFALAGASSNWVASGAGITYETGDQVVTTDGAENLTSSSANISANITNIGSGNANKRGVCYGTDDCLTIENSKVEEIGSFESGTYSLSLTGLIPTTQYYVRAYTINDIGISYGNVISFTTDAISLNSGNALDFDGVDDYVSVPHMSDFSTNTFTVEFWARAKSGQGTYRSPFSSRLESSNYFSGVNFYATDANKWNVSIGTGLGSGSGGSWVGVSGPDVILNEWVHLAATYDGTALTLYVNGVNVGSTVTSYEPGGTYPPIYIGRNETYYFPGQIDELKYWNYARTECEISGLMNRSLTGHEDGLLLYYNFNSGIAGGDNEYETSVTDLTDYELDGYLYNFALAGSTSNWVASGADLLGNVNLQKIKTVGTGKFTPTSTIINATITDIGSGNATKRGVCYGTNSCIWVTDSKVEESGSYGLGNFSETITGLVASTKYYARAYSINDSGVAYGDIISFSIPPLTELTTLPGVYNSASALGDFNNDGSLDIILTGNTGGSTPTLISKIFKNNGDNTFTELAGTNFIGVEYGSVAWADLNNDGWIDIVLSGKDASGTPVAKIYKNNGDGSFAEQAGISLTGVYSGSISCADYNNDGLIDLLITGFKAANNPTTKIYRNYGNFLFVDQAQIQITKVGIGSAAWGDYDNDGLQDILLTGQDDSRNRVTKIFRNNGDNSFSEQTSFSFVGLINSTMQWGDYNNDGYLDFYVTGCYVNSGNTESHIYKNNGNNSFSESGIYISTLYQGSVAWADYNNDGNLDIVVSGSYWNDSTINATQIYKNNGVNSFELQQDIPLPGVVSGTTNWGDFNNDGNLDFLITGSDIDGNALSKIYYGNCLTPNTKPNAPSELSATWNASTGCVDLLWTKPTDNQTPASALTYNIRMGTTSGGANIVSPMANTTNGYRTIVGLGATSNNFKSVRIATPGTYYFSVQAIDNAFAGSAFTVEGSIVINTPAIPAVPVAIAATDIAATGFTANWNTSGGALSYTLQISTDNQFTQNVVTLPEIQHLSQIIQYLNPTSTYYYRVKAVNIGGASSYSDTITVNTLFEQFTPQNFVGIENLSNSSASWGDFDNDGDLDLIIAGTKGFYQNSIDMTKIYRNDGNNVFTELTSTPITGIGGGSVQWGDYNNDGFLDIVISGGNYVGETYQSTPVTKIYKNNGDGTFTEQTAINLPQMLGGTAKWGDYDNDGYLDILINGRYYDQNGNGFNATKFFKNNGDNTFTEQTQIQFEGLDNSITSLCDYNNDGFLDVLLSGDYYNAGNGNKTLLYKNNGDNTFTLQSNIQLPGISLGTSSWGDFDGDGYQDLLLVGYNASSGNFITAICKNNAGTSFDQLAGVVITSGFFCSASWGDYNNDGKSDILIAGQQQNGTFFSKVYKNGGDNTFTDQTDILLQAAGNGKALWADCNNDGKLDILLTGNYHNIQDYQVTKLYKNNETTVNTKPDAPTNLAASWNGTTGFIDLSWDKANDVQSASNALTYNIRVGTSSNGVEVISPMSSVTDGYRQLVNTGNSLANHISVNVSTLGKYYWSVQSIDNGFVGSDFATEGSFTLTTPTVPTAPVAADATSITASEFTANWATSADTKTYTLEVATNNLFTENLMTFANLSDLSKRITGLTPSTTYHYRVRAVNLIGEGDYSNTITVVTLATPTAPAAPVAADATPITASEFTANWAASADAKTYTLEVATNSLFTENLMTFANLSDLSKRITGLTPSTTYHYRVRAVNLIGEGDYSNTITVVTLAAPTVPAAPVAADAASITATEFTSNWAATAGVGTYTLEVATNNLFTENLVTFTNLTDLSKSIIGLTPSTTYYYRVRAVNLVGESENSNTIMVVTLAAPTVPAAPVATDAASITATEFTSNWAATAGVGTYTLEVATNNLFTENLVTFADLSDLSKRITGLTPSTTYYYRVRAVNLVGESENSNTIMVVTLAAPTVPAAPVAADGTSITTSEFTANWAATADAKTYTLEVATNNLFTENLVTFTNLTDLSKRIIGLTPSTTYYYRVRAVNLVGESENSNTIMVVTLAAPTVPAAPVAADGTSIATSEFTANWAASADAKTYTLEVATNSLFTENLMTFTNQSDLSKRITGLTPSTTYYYRVRAVNPIGESDNSNTTSVTTLSSPFIEQSIALDQLGKGTITWGDYNNDGFLDILLTGEAHDPVTGDVTYIAKIYKNNGDNTFTEQSAISLAAMMYQKAVWGDYDNDGFIDLLVTGESYNATNNTYSYLTKLYRNDGGTNFIEQTGTGLPNIYEGGIAWGDFNNDGLQDALLSGFSQDEGKQVSSIYLNKGNGTFIHLNSAELEGVNHGSVALGDYNNDGYLDVLLSGQTNNLAVVSVLYKNNGNNSFTRIDASLTGISNGSTAWGDYDNDGLLDILVNGFDQNNNPIAKVYRNNGGDSFTEQAGINLPQVGFGSANWGDYNSDGKLDILLTGSYYDSNEGKEIAISKIFRNNSSNDFSEVQDLPFEALKYSTFAWGDYNNDGKLDLVMSGQDLKTNDFVLKIYSNNSLTANSKPTAPAGLTATSGWAITKGGVDLSWTKSSDAETPQSGLSYNLRIGTSNNGISVVSPMANMTNGYRMVVANGNAGSVTTNFHVDSLAAGIYYWSVQAIDNGFVGSDFATEGSFTITAQTTPKKFDVLAPFMAYCANTNGVTIELSGSEVGVNYQLKKNGNSFGNSVVGTGSPISWNNQLSGVYAIEATNAIGTTTMNNSTSITENPLPSDAGTIAGSTTVNQGQNAVTYTVPTISEATSYVWTLPNGVTGSSTTNSITVDFGVNAQAGDIKVKGQNDCGFGSESSLSINVVTNVNDVTISDEISVYPNPADNQLFIKFNSSTVDSYKVEMFNNVGGLVETLQKDKADNSSNINISSIPSGLYILRISTWNKVYFSKVLKK